MKNYVQKGDTLTFTCEDTGGISSGAGVLFGSMFGVAAKDAAAGEEYEAMVTGVFELPKNSSSFTAMAKVYWTGTTCASSGTNMIGVAVEAADTNAATVKVRLNGVSIV